MASPHAISLLLILILLAPIQALDDVLTSLMSVFASPQSIFFRKYVLGPGLRLGVVLLLIVGGSGVGFLAVGYVAAGAFGIALYVVILWQVLGRRGMIARFRTSSMKIPAREILVFTIPLLTTDLVYVFLNTSDAIILEHFKGLDAVAAWRVVQPAAGLNTLVLSSFTLLFTPAAARLLARNDRDGIRELYWSTAIWMAVVSFPLFALTFTMAQALTLQLYGPRYADSAVYMALLSFGYYFNTALGFNGLTLRIFGVIRFRRGDQPAGGRRQRDPEPDPHPAVRRARRGRRHDPDPGHPQPAQAIRAAARNRDQHLRVAAPPGLPGDRRGDGQPPRG